MRGAPGMLRLARRAVKRPDELVIFGGSGEGAAALSACASPSNWQEVTITTTSSPLTSAKPSEMEARRVPEPVRISTSPVRSAVSKRSCRGSTPKSPSLPGSTTESTWP